MTRSEYEEKIKALGINLRRLDIEIGEKTNVPDSMGCYFEDGEWAFYGVNERQDLVVTRKGSEEEIFAYLYTLTLAKAEEMGISSKPEKNGKVVSFMKKLFKKK